MFLPEATESALEHQCPVRALLRAYLSWKEPEEKVAVVSLIHSDVAGITRQIPSWERSHRAQPSSWGGKIFTRGLDK